MMLGCSTSSKKRRLGKLKNPKICKKFSENIPDPYGFGHYELYNQINKSILKNKKFIISKQDCFKTILLLNAFYFSHENKKTIKINNKVESKNLGKKNEKIAKLYRFKK